TRAEIAERLRHLGVAEPSFNLTLGVELGFWAQRDSTPPRASAMVLAHQVEHDAVQPASKFGHLPRGTAAYERPQTRLLHDLFGYALILYERRGQLEGGTAEMPRPWVPSMPVPAHPSPNTQP